MTGEELLEKLELADPAYVLAASEPLPAKKRPWTRRALLAAACVCVLASAAAAFGGGTRLLDSFTARQATPDPDFTESGYDLEADVERFPVSALTGEIRRVGEEIVRQFENASPLSGRLPGFWKEDFPSAADALDYVGLKTLRGLDWDLEETRTSLRVTGNSQGQLLHVQLETDYEVEGVRLQAFSDIYLEGDESGAVIGVRTTEDVEFSESSYLSANGRRCQVITDTGLASGYHSMDGYLVADGVLYNLHLAYLKEDEALAESLLHRWADLF